VFNPFTEVAGSDTTDAELVEQAKNGDRTALEKLVLRHQAWIYNIAVRMVFQPHDAEEVTQEVLVKVITKLSTFQGESNFRTWLYRIAANHVLNMKRRRAETRVTTFAAYGAAIERTPDLDLPDPKSVPVALPLLVEEAKIGCTMGMLLCLDRKQRLIFTLGEILGVSDSVAGEVLEMSAENFRQCLSRARREPNVPERWVRVKVSHASLNRHDVFTLRGISGHPEGITYPIILGNDGAGTLDDGTPVVIYPVMGSEDWRGDETLDPQWHIPSEFIHGTFATYAVVPKRNAIQLPKNLAPLHASVLGTAWLTAYRALFTKSGLQAGETVLIQGASGGMATALIQLGRAAGFEVWVTSRSEEGRHRAKTLGAHQTFPPNHPLPQKVPAIVDSVGSDSWSHSMSSLTRGGTLVTVGGTTGLEVPLNLLPVIANQLTITGSIIGTLDDMQNMMNLIAQAGIEPEVGTVLPMDHAEEGFRAMWEGRTHGKTVFTRT